LYYKIEDVSLDHCILFVGYGLTAEIKEINDEGCRYISYMHNAHFFMLIRAWVEGALSYVW
jgi:hypothetical protein